PSSTSFSINASSPPTIATLSLHDALPISAGGVTTIVDMPYDAGRLICTAERLGLKAREAQQQAHVDFALYATVHPDDGSKHIDRSEEHTSELQSRENLVCRLLLEKKKKQK